ncbi:hypothetical protein ABZ547_26835 [Streptomyces sparsogenes]|uniref:hypothetical protein n=1 Tax=Streptomyces sparsogenes TaxID=67365 RepID=UPI0033DDD492
MLYPLARIGRRKARQLFPAPAHRIQDAAVLRVQRARTWTAAVIGFMILSVYGKPGDMTQAQEQYLLRLMITPWLVILTAPVVLAVLFRRAAPHVRQAMEVRLTAALWSAIWYFGIFTLVPVLALAAHYGGQFSGPLTTTSMGLLLFKLLAFGVFGPVIWALGLVLVSTGPAFRSAFNTSGLHPALPAILTGALVWEFMAVSLATGGLPPGPPLVGVCALLGGPVSVTAVAWWEIHRLRTRYGISL